MTTPGDQARAMVLVEVEPELAWRAFTEEIDQWWRRGPRFRASGPNHGVLCLEAGVGGRLFETFDTPRGNPRMIETGRVTVWDPPRQLVFDWRATNFATSEKTEVEVTFDPSPSGTRVTVTHRGWAAIRADHPVRHNKPVPEFIAEMSSHWGALLTALRVHAAPGD